MRDGPFWEEIRAWRKRVEDGAIQTLGPQLVDGWHDGLMSNTLGQIDGGRLLCGAWADTFGNPRERWAAEDPREVLDAPHLVLKPRDAAVGPTVDVATLPARQFLKFWGWDTGATTFDVFAYEGIPMLGTAPEVGESTRYQLFEQGPSGILHQVGALYRQHPGGTDWVEHWVLWHNYRSPSATISVWVSRVAEPAGTLQNFLQYHRNHDAQSQTTSRYALVELSWTPA